MNAIGWQICGVLIGVSTIIIAVYLAKTLNSTSKTIDNANNVVSKVSRMVDENEKDINTIVKSVASIIENVDSIVETVANIGSYLNIFKFFSKKRKSKKKK